DVDQFGDSSIWQNTVAPKKGADTGGGNVMTHLFARRSDLVDATTVPVSRIFDRLRHMCLDTRGNSYRKILHQNESAQRADGQLVSHTRAYVSETVSLHTQSDMLGHTPSSSLVAPLNHAYLCMDVTKHTIRPQIISFLDDSLKDGSKTAANQRSSFLSQTTSDSRARLVANFEESLANPGVTTPPVIIVILKSLLYRNCDQKCRYCSCLFWYDERLKGAKYDGQLEYHLCYEGGKIYIPQALVPPVFIRQLLTNNHFMEHIRAYNQMSAMTSFGDKVDDLNFRGRHQHTLNPQIVEGLVRVLDENNALVRLFKTARDRCSAGDIPGMKIMLYSKGGIRRYELPSSDLLGRIVFEDDPKS
nr:helitron helicase-like domain-containing protein [Tanacetum cinerariifolium]